MILQINYTAIRNLKWSNSEHTAFNCEVNFNHLIEEFVPFHCTKEEAESLIYSHTTEIWEKALSGDFGTISEYEEPEIVDNPNIPIIESTTFSGDFT